MTLLVADSFATFRFPIKIYNVLRPNRLNKHPWGDLRIKLRKRHGTHYEIRNLKLIVVYSLLPIVLIFVASKLKILFYVRVRRYKSFHPTNPLSRALGQR